MTGIEPEWTLGDRLRKAREFAGLTGIEFEEQTGISRRSITNYESDIRPPGKPQLLMWAMRTGVSLRWLTDGQYGGPDDPPPGKRSSSYVDFQRLLQSVQEEEAAVGHSDVA